MQQTRAEIDLAALSHNLAVAKKRAGKSNILAVVKANAYGHGAVEVSKHLVRNGVSCLGVAYTGEAMALRDAGIKVPILVFFDRDTVDEYFTHNLTPVIFDINTARKLSREAVRRKCTLRVHVKADTGMGRIGFTSDIAQKEITRIAGLKNIALEGLMSHFSEADLQNKDFAEQQLRSFLALKKGLEKEKIRFNYFHIANSAAVLTMPDSHFNMVRPGIMLYGYGDKDLKPVLGLKSRVLMLKKVPAGTPISYGRTFVTKKKSIIATVPAGYADGYNRRLSNQGEVLINGRRAPVAGRVCMDTIMVDVTEIPGVTTDSEVILLGSQGKEKITAADIAQKTGTIPYEVLTSVGNRIQREYK